MLRLKHWSQIPTPGAFTSVAHDRKNFPAGNRRASVPPHALILGAYPTLKHERLVKRAFLFAVKQRGIHSSVAGRGLFTTAQKRNAGSSHHRTVRCHFMNAKCYVCGGHLTTETAHELFSHESGMCKACRRDYEQFCADCQMDDETPTTTLGRELDNAEHDYAWMLQHETLEAACLAHTFMNRVRKFFSYAIQKLTP